MKNKIGWCSMTWNPVRGCLNNCEYCYARIIAKRFWIEMYNIELKHYYKKHPTWAWTGDHLSGLKDFKPTFLEAQFDKKLPDSSQKIFVGSMSEIYYWEPEWIEKVIDKIKQYPRHIFQFLTKHLEVYDKWIWPKNCWLGVTITREKDFDKQNNSFYFYGGNHITFFSFEPLLESINSRYLNNSYIDWVITGAETANRSGKIIPKKEWIKIIVDYCRDNVIPIYLKDSLRNIYPERIKEFPGTELKLF